MASWRRAAANTRQPRSRSWCAVAKPMPLEAPVTKTLGLEDCIKRGNSTTLTCISAGTPDVAPLRGLFLRIYLFSAVRENVKTSHGAVIGEGPMVQQQPTTAQNTATRITEDQNHFVL